MSLVPALRQAPIGVAAVLWLVVVAVALASRPVLPVDETRYLAVAWEMWSRGDFVLPTLNGEAYSHKPPLLFWIIHAGWAVFGVNEWWPRLVAPLFGLAALFLTRALALRLWPERHDAASAAPLVLMASGFWALFTTLTMFDMILAFFALVGLIGILDAWRHGGWRGWAVLGVALGLGILTKGPAIALHVLPVALLAPLWGGRLEGSHREPGGWGGWYGGIACALVLGLALALAWAVPAAIQGGAAFRDAIFWGQTAGRMVESFAHGRPWWWYLATTPPLLAPLILWPGLWRSPGPGRRGTARLSVLVRARLPCLLGDQRQATALPLARLSRLGAGPGAHAGSGPPSLPSWADSLAPGWAVLAISGDRRGGRPAGRASNCTTSCPSFPPWRWSWRAS